MRKLRNVARNLCGLTLALVGLTSLAAGQNNPPSAPPVWGRVGSTQAAYSLAIDPRNPNTVYAGVQGGVLKSADGGASWQATGVGGDVTVALVIDRVNPNTIYAGVGFTSFCHHSYRRLFKTVDGGANWNDGASPPINGCDNIYALVMHPTDPKTLFVANFDDFGDSFSPLIRSDNGGASWTPLYGPPLAALAIDPHQPNTLYAGTFDFTYFGYEGPDSRNGVLKSTDGGVRWNPTGLTNTGVDAVAIDPVNPGTLYAATRGIYSGPRGFRGLFKSTDGGANWSAINNGLAHLIGSDSGRRGLLPAARASLVIDPDDPRTLYAGFPGRGVFKSADGGANWGRFSEGLTELDVRALALAPGNPNTLYAATSGGVFKITDNTPTANPIDDARFFVRQQYLDFLSREPEAGGFDAWVGVLNNCTDSFTGPGVPSGCDRILVSQSFFGSPEFQLKGFYAFRFYKLAFDRLPEYAEITADMSIVAGATPEEVYARKAGLAASFTQRQEFQTAFGTLTNAGYVSALLGRYGLTQISTPDPLQPDGAAQVTLTAAELTTRLDAAALSRAQVFRAVADSDEVSAREYNRAFVAMQYYGYLRRKPEEEGYQAWLRVLQSGDIRTMVHGFVNSTEYRRRFGQP